MHKDVDRSAYIHKHIILHNKLIKYSLGERKWIPIKSIKRAAKWLFVEICWYGWYADYHVLRYNAEYNNHFKICGLSKCYTFYIKIYKYLIDSIPLQYNTYWRPIQYNLMYLNKQHLYSSNMQAFLCTINRISVKLIPSIICFSQYAKYLIAIVFYSWNLLPIRNEAPQLS